MQCVEFEMRLNELLDERVAPVSDVLLADHAGACGKCSQLLAASELLLEGVESLPAVHLCSAERHALAYRVVADVGSGALSAFPANGEVELATRRTAVVVSHARPPLALIGFSLAAAAAILIAGFAWNRADRPIAEHDPSGSSLAEKGAQTQPETPQRDPIPNDLQPIEWIGFQVADGLKPVTESMVSAYREFRKRPLFRNEQGRSSFYSPRDDHELLA
jgi:hypothetical protein